MARQSIKETKPGPLLDLMGVARAALIAEGETPEAWIMIVRQDAERTAVLCTTPPLAIAPVLPAFRMAAPVVHAATRIVVDKKGTESIACASRGYLGAILCDLSYSDADAIAGYVEVQREVVLPGKETNLAAIIRRSIAHMMHLAHKLTAHEQWLVDDTPKMALKALPSPDSRVAYSQFSADTTLGDLWQAYSKAGSRANLLRLRQGASGCGGCGRCCYDLTFRSRASMSKA